MNTINNNLYNIFKNDFHLSDEKARVFSQAVQTIAEEQVKNVTNAKNYVKEYLLTLEPRLTREIASAESKLSDKISNLYKWLIGLFITLMVAILGLYATIIFKHG